MSEENTKYKILNKEEKSGSEVELEIEVSADTVNYFKEDAIKELGAEVEIDGFRKGKAPEKLVMEQLSEMQIVEKSAYKAINNLVPIIITNEKLQALSMPGISITKIAANSPLVFKMNVTLLPTVELADYKKIAKETEAIEEQKIEDKEVDDYIEYIRQQRAQSDAMTKGEKFDPEKAELPEVNDDFVKTLGNFKTVDDFKKELKKNMLTDKENKAKESRRIKMIEKIIDESKVDVPNVMVEQEIERMLSKFKHDIQNFKMNPEDYLKQINKTEDDLKKEWKPDAIKRSKMNLILPKIAAEEKIKADEEAVKKELEHLKSHDKDLNEEHAKVYVEHVLTNEAVFKFLEEQK